ncbi:MAG TPA: hemolysin family protein [Longimicrobiales bacterium]
MTLSSLLPAVIILLLIALNGLFVAAEFAIVGVSRAELARAGRERRHAVRLARSILRDPRRQDRFIATAQLGITAASLGLGMYGEHVLAGWMVTRLEAWGTSGIIAAHSVASVLAVTVLTYAHIVLGEMVPKSVALQRARATVLWIAPIMQVVQLVVYPFVVALNGLGNAVLKVFGVNRTKDGRDQFRTPEEIAFVVQESQAGGLLRHEAAQVVGELLEFGDLTAEMVMVPRVRVMGIPVGATAELLASVLQDSPHTRYPVYDGTLDRIIGALHVRDILDICESNQPVAARHGRPVPFVPGSARVDRVLAAMRDQRAQLAVVMDEHGGTAGIVSLEDLFEEVIGDITERSAELGEIVREPAGTLLVDGGLRLEELGDALGVVLQHAEIDTVSGLILELLGRPAAPGDTVLYEEASFAVVTVHERGVRQCRVTLAAGHGLEP